jgi:hypothetical protein
MTLDELAQEMAERQEALLREVAALRERVTSLEARPIPAPAEPPQVNVAAPNVTVDSPRVEATVNIPPPADCDLHFEWGMDSGHFVPVRATIRRN